MSVGRALLLNPDYFMWKMHVADIFSLLRQEYSPILTSGEMFSHPGGWDKPIPEVIYLWRHRTSTPNNVEKSRLVGVLDIFCTFLDKNEKNNQTPHWGRDEGIHLVSKVCYIHDSASLVVDCKSWTLGWDSLVPPSMSSDSIILIGSILNNTSYAPYILQSRLPEQPPVLSDSLSYTTVWNPAQ